MTTIPVPTQENTFVDEKGVTHWKPETVKVIIDTLKDKPTWVDSNLISMMLVVETGSTPPQDASVDVYDKLSDALEKDSSSLHGGQLLLVASTSSSELVKEVFPTSIAMFRYMGKEDSKLVEESKIGPVADIADVDKALGGGDSGYKTLALVGGAVVVGVLLTRLMFKK